MNRPATLLRSTVPSPLDELRSALLAGGIVNLTGPLGIGKSALAAKLHAPTVDLAVPGALDTLPALLAAAPEHLVLDHVDGVAADAVRALLAGHRVRGTLVLVSRVPVHVPGHETVLVDVPAWADRAIDGLSLRSGIAATEARRAVIELSRGNPLVAATVVTALQTGTAPEARGALADSVAGAVTARIASEGTGRRWQHALRMLAALGTADEALLGGGPDLFTTLARLSIVRRVDLGIELTAPFRALFDQAYQWRDAGAHRKLRLRATNYRAAHQLRAPTSSTDTAEAIADALTNLRNSGALTSSSLLHGALTPTVPQLRGWLHDAVEALADSSVPTEADAGKILQQYYIRGGSNHLAIARRLHLSRATYFRRQRTGIQVLANWYDLGIRTGRTDAAAAAGAVV